MSSGEDYLRKYSLQVPELYLSPLTKLVAADYNNRALVVKLAVGKLHNQISSDLSNQQSSYSVQRKGNTVYNYVVSGADFRNKLTYTWVLENGLGFIFFGLCQQQKE